MAYELKYTDKDGVLVVKVTGHYADVEEFIGKMKEEKVEFLARGAKRILFDDRELDMILDVLDAVIFAESVLEDEVQTEGYRYACLPPESGRRFYATFETILQNRSINYRLFDNEAEAIHWLNA